MEGLTSNWFNINKLLDYTGPNTKILTIPSFHFCETDPVFLQKTRINEINKNSFSKMIIKNKEFKKKKPIV